MTEHRLLDLAALARQLVGGAHSVFSPSGSPMWLACSGSLIPNVLAVDAAGVDAAYGTVAHSLTEEWLRTHARPEYMLGRQIFIESGDWGHLITIDEEMFGYAEECVDRCTWLPGDHIVEYRVDFSHLTPIPGQGGTLDFAAMRPGTGEPVDHKFGSSPENIVYAEENSQLMLYALGLDKAFYDKYRFKEFILRINQPRLNHFDEWRISRRDLIDWGDTYVRERAAAAWQLDAPRTPGIKQCRFCKIRSTCAANAKMQDDLCGEAFGDTTTTVQEMQQFISRLDGDDLEPYRMHFESIGSLSTAQMAKLLPFRKQAESWWAALDEELERRALNGEKVPGYKLVEARTYRQWQDENAASAHLRKLGLPMTDLYQTSFVSPAQAEDLLQKKLKFKTKQLPELMTGLIRKPPGKPTLVPLKDKRGEVADVSAQAFGDTHSIQNRESEEL